MCKNLTDRMRLAQNFVKMAQLLEERAGIGAEATNPLMVEAGKCRENARKLAILVENAQSMR